MHLSIKRCFQKLVFKFREFERSDEVTKKFKKIKLHDMQKQNGKIYKKMCIIQFSSY